MAAYIYLETAVNSGEFNCRGELGVADNPEAFARHMGNNGLRVIVTNGDEIGAGEDEATVEAQGLTLRTLGGVRSGIQDIAQRLKVVA